MIALVLFLQAAAADAPRLEVPPGYPPPQRAAKIAGAVEQVMLAPIFRLPHSCAEHPFGELGLLGDELGTDCVVEGGVTRDGGYLRPFRTDGQRNEDWYGWRADVLAPAAGIVELVWLNPLENAPGMLGRPPASEITIRTADGVMLALGHVTAPTVRKGDRVVAGQVIAKVGNNGVSRSPHVHVGAYRIADRMPLQIRWDRRALARLLSGE